MNFDEHGAQLWPGAVAGALVDIRAVLAGLPRDRAGIRISGNAALRPFLVPEGQIGHIASAVLGMDAQPVRVVLFDKTAATNWSLAWHQDRTICVRQRVDVEGFGPWTTKQGMCHVAPPFDLLARMVTLRVHLDDVPETNAPLLVAPGSHRKGLVPVERIKDVVRQCGQYACIAEAGDIWLYSTPILHASEAATRAASRRVLQVDYSVDVLPGRLEWLGV